jgi:hypothetical protein
MLFILELSAESVSLLLPLWMRISTYRRNFNLSIQHRRTLSAFVLALLFALEALRMVP